MFPVETQIRRAEGGGLLALHGVSLLNSASSVLLLLLAACSSGSPQDGSAAGADPQINRPPTVRSVTIVPTPLTLAGPVAVHVDAQDPEGGQVSNRFQWIVNGNFVLGATGPELGPNRAKKGDEISIEVVASDGVSESTPYRIKPVVVGNAPPTIVRVALEAGSTPGDARVYAKVDALDPDGDEIQYVYRWWRNDKPIKEGEENFLETAGLGRKDVVMVEVVVRDDEAMSPPVRATPIVLGNSPPQIISNPVGLNNREHYEYVVQAKDPDGDSIAYGLEIAPPGMTIDRLSGQISWNVLPGSSGAHRVKVMVEDGQGGTAWQEFEISVPSAAQSSPNQPSRG